MKRKRIKAVLERSASGFLAFMMLFGSINASVLAENSDAEPTPEPAAEILQEETVSETPEEEQTAEENVSEEGKEDSPAAPTESPVEASPDPKEETAVESPAPEDETSEKTEEVIEEENAEEVESEEVNEEAEETQPPLEVYVAENAADMAAAVASLSDDSAKRIVVETETDLKEIVADSGKAVYYDGSYVITMNDSASVDAALWQINEAEGESKAVRDDRITICENDGEAEEEPSIGDSIDSETVKAAEEGLSLHDVTDSTSSRKLVALIDTGVNGDVAARSINLTDDGDGDANGHGTRMAQAISQASDGHAVILSIKAFNDDGTASLANVYAAVKYAIEAKADIINISASVPDSANTAALRNMILEAMNNGISVVVAAGNAHADASGFFPANVEGVIAVGAVTEEGTLVETSNYGDCVKLYVLAGSTSLAAAKLAGFKAADKVDGNPEIYFGVVPGAASSQTLPVADPKDPSKLYVNDDCYTAPGCRVTKERSGMYNGHYITFFHADNASFLCYEENVLFQDGYYIITSYDVNPDDALLAAYAYQGGHFVDAQLAVWGVDREATLAAAYAWAASQGGGESVSYSPDMEGPSTYVPGETVTFTDTNGQLSEYDYYVSDVEVSGGDDIHSSDVEVELSGNEVKVRVKETAKEVPETITVSLESSKPNVEPQSECTGGLAYSPGSQTLLYCGQLSVVPGETYDDAEFTIRLGVHGEAEIYKVDKDRNDQPGQGDATLAGAVFTVTNRRNNRVVTTMTTDASGYASAKNLKWGDYSIKETTPPEGYFLDSEWSDSFEIRTNGEKHTAQYKVIDPVYHGGIEVTKFDTDRYATNHGGPNLEQGDAKLAGAEYTIYNVSKADVYVAGRWVPTGTSASEANKIITLTTDDKGHAQTETDYFPYGSYLIKETKAPKGYNLNENWYSIVQIREDGKLYDAGQNNTKASDNAYAGFPVDDVIRGGVKFQKTDAERNTANAQGDATLKDAEITIFSISAKDVYAAADQNTSSMSWIDKGADVDTTVGPKYVDLLHGEKDPRDFSNAKKVVTIKTNETGYAALGAKALPYGTYFAVETKPSKGYLLNTEWKITFEIRKEGEILDFTDSDPQNPNYSSDKEHQLKEQVIRGDVRIEKQDLELAELNGVSRSSYINDQGGYTGGEEAHQTGSVNPSQAIGGKNHSANRMANLNNITFTITNVSTLSILSDAGELVEYAPGSVVTTIKTYYDEELGKYVACTKDKALPYGTYTIQETKTNNAYLMTDGTPRTFEIEKDGEVVWKDTQTHHNTKSGEAMIFRNQIIRGEFEFVKIMTRTSQRMQTLWVLENATSGEKHVIVTDPNGEYHSNEFPHSQDTNGNDGLLEKIEQKGYDNLISLTAGLEDGSILEYHGLWFGLGEDGDMADVNDNLSSLPYGQYNLHEVRTDTNEGSELQNLAFYVTRDNKLIHLGTITDYQITLQTVATDKDSGTHFMKPGTSSVIVDKVTYHGIEEFGNYTLKSYLVDADTGEMIVDASGNEVSVTTELQLMKDDGKIDVELAFDSTNLGGKTIVVFEELYNADGERVSSHMDLLDSNQTVSIPGIGTTIADVTIGKDNPKEGVIYLKDTVSYNGLTAGVEYTMTGTLMNKATGEPFNGAKPVTKKFTPAASSGTIDIEFEVSASLLSGKTVVAFESCSKDGVEVAVHADINDENQTYEYHGPELHTTATDEDGDHTASASEQLKIIDKVQYKNLTVGKEYELKGTLHIKNADGSDAGTYKNADGSDYIVTKTFTPTQSDDFVTIEFTVNASDLVERSLVVFENLYQDGKLVTVHAEISDKDQTVDIEKPTIRTTATNKADNGKTIVDRGLITIHDEVSYTGLVAGRTYTLTGTLHINKDGRDAGPLKIEGKEVTNTVTFVPEKSSGTVGMDFTFNSKEITGTARVVAFETVKLEEKEIAVHADITDEGQTVTFTVKPPTPPTPPTPPSNPEYPEIHTTAYSAKDGYDYVEPIRNVTIRDRVYYNNLIPGVEYEMRGELHRKNPGGRDDGVLFVNGQYVTSSIRFTPTSKSGYVELSFTFDASALNEVTTVAFERLYYQGIEVTSHTDINDEEQTILITDNHKYRRRRAAWINTGAGKDFVVYGGTGIAALVVLIYLLKTRKKETVEEVQEETSEE